MAPICPPFPRPPFSPSVPQTKQYLFSTLVWHERLLYDEDTWTAAQSLASRWGGMRGMFGRKAA